MRGLVVWVCLLGGCDEVFPIEYSGPTNFDPSMCPGSYMTITGQSSRYRWAAPNIRVTWQGAESTCEGERVPGGPAIHLVEFETLAERQAVIPVVAPTQNYNYIWTTYFQSRTATLSDWSSILGDAPLIDWDLTEPSRTPDPSVTADCAIVEFDNTVEEGKYADFPLSYTANYICECDGTEVVKRPVL